MFQKLEKELFDIYHTDYSNYHNQITSVLASCDRKAMHSFGFLSDDNGQVIISEALQQYLEYTDVIQSMTILSFVTRWVRSKKTRTMTNFAHWYIDKQINKCDSAYPPSCKKGCCFCCFQKIHITPDEAKLIKEYLRKDFSKYVPALKQQAAWTTSDWNKKEYEEKKCPFLIDSLCAIYEVRPIACRNHIAVNDPVICKTQPEKVQNIGQLECSILISAFLTEYGFEIQTSLLK